ncbi:MAG: beta-ketoacyl-[acyl-carrier-protein] synthase family protein [Spirochaetales bacterium]|nr:beta-ketoacyl-[acyl-carrier-protein] synthase family protein [Spirochaetales bacterium]
MKRVVVTGIGAVTSLGTGREALFSSLLAGKRSGEPVPEEFEKSYRLSSRFYVSFPESDLTAYGITSPYLRIMQEEDRCAVLASKLAIEDAGFSLRQKNKYFTCDGLIQCGIVLGTGFSGLDTAFISYCAHRCGEKGVSGNGKNPVYNRMVIPRLMPNSIAAWVSIFFGITGGSSTLNASCASGTVAVGRAFRLIRDGYYPSVLAGGVECLKESSGALMRGFDMLGALTTSEDGNPRPFSRKRSGFLFSEGGGCVLVLEELDHARGRGADVYAEIIDYRENSDAWNIVQIEPSASRIIGLLSALKGKRKIDYINTHGTGTETNDATEALAIRKVFDEKERPLTNSTKALLGHTIGASGAIEAAVTALSIKNGTVHGSPVDDPLDIAIAQETVHLPITHAISTSYGFGGHNAGLLFRRCDDHG